MQDDEEKESERERERERESENKKRRRRRKKKNGNSFLRSKTSDNDNSLKIHSYFILLDYLSPSLGITVSIRRFFCHAYTNITLMHEYEGIALEKLDLCRLLDMFDVNKHASFMDYYISNTSMMRNK